MKNTSCALEEISTVIYKTNLEIRTSFLLQFAYRLHLVALPGKAKMF